jgi:hypothetical protein
VLSLYDGKTTSVWRVIVEGWSGSAAVMPCTGFVMDACRFADGPLVCEQCNGAMLTLRNCVFARVSGFHFAVLVNCSFVEAQLPGDLLVVQVTNPAFNATWAPPSWVLDGACLVPDEPEPKPEARPGSAWPILGTVALPWALLALATSVAALVQGDRQVGPRRLAVL